MTLSEIRGRWAAKRDELAKLKASVDGATLCDQLLEDLDQLALDPKESLTLSQASARSGYTTDHLSRLIRQGKLKNVGRKGSPRVFAADLPKRPTPKSLADRSSAPYDAATDARLLRIRR